MDINRINYEKFFLLYLDRELAPVEMREVEKFLAENSDLQKEFSLLQQTVFIPETIRFEQKELLFRKEEKRRVIPLYRLRIAAAIAGLLLGSWYIITQVGREAERNGVDKQITAAANEHKTVVPATNNAATIAVQHKDDLKQEAALATVQVNVNQSRKQIQKKTETNVMQRDVQQIEVATQSQADNNPEETPLLMKKSNASTEIQSSVANNPDPRSVSSNQAGTDPMMLTAAPPIAAATGNASVDVSQYDTQAENAISVVALNNPNKGISKFFKKFASPTPEAEGSRKIRVSVFQISY